MTLFEIVVISYIALVYLINLITLILFWGDVFEGVRAKRASNVFKAILVFLVQPLIMLVLVPMVVASVHSAEEAKARSRERKREMLDEQTKFMSFLREKGLKEEYEKHG